MSTDGAEHATFLALGEQPLVEPGEIFALDSTRYPDGNYGLRLRVVHSDANYDEYVTPVTILNSQPVDAASPVLLATTPAGGAAWDGSPIIFTFDRAMATATITVTPNIEGKTSVDGAKVAFTPADKPTPNTLYRFTITEGQAADGTPLAYAQKLTVQAIGPLAVAASQPSDGAEDADPTAPITSNL